MLAEVKDQVESGLEFVHLGDFCPADLNEIDHIFVLQELENSDLPQGSDGEL